jgi:SAM-dependent methyltransferase
VVALPDSNRAAVVRAQYRENGLRWTALQVMLWAAERAGAERAGQSLKGRMRKLELDRGLTGQHTKEANREGWNTYDWSGKGEEWTPGPEWRQAVIDEVLLANLPASAPEPASLEIGPGAGRWSEALQAASKRLVLADIAEEPIELCRKRFAGADNVEYLVTDGSSLAGIESGSIDYVWSFDVFVHIAPVDQRAYLAELSRVMRPGARGVIHHAGRGGLDGGWRTSMTSELFGEMLDANGLAMARQFASWGAGAEFRVPIPGDVVTVFEKRVEKPAS